MERILFTAALEFAIGLFILIAGLLGKMHC